MLEPAAAGQGEGGESEKGSTVQVRASGGSHQGNDSGEQSFRLCRNEFFEHGLREVMWVQVAAMSLGTKNLLESAFCVGRALRCGLVLQSKEFGFQAGRAGQHDYVCIARLFFNLGSPVRIRVEQGCDTIESVYISLLSGVVDDVLRSFSVSVADLHSHARRTTDEHGSQVLEKGDLCIAFADDQHGSALCA